MASLQKRGESFFITVSMPDGKGGYLRKTETYKPPSGLKPEKALEKAKEYAKDFERKCKGLTEFNENMLLDELWEWYKTHIAPNKHKGSTRKSDSRNYDTYLKPILGHYKLKQLTPITIDKALNMIQVEGGTKRYYKLISPEGLTDALHTVGGSFRKMSVAGVISVDRMTKLFHGGRTIKEKAQAIADYCKVPLETLFEHIPSKPLSPNTVKSSKRVLSALLSTATKKGIIRYNPMLHVENIKSVPSKRVYMTLEQAKLFLSRLKKLKNISVRALLVTALFTGMRSGELRALLWSDIDTTNCQIRINKTIDEDNDTTLPKTDKSVRIVIISPVLAEFLEQYRKEQQDHIQNSRGRIEDNGIVFPSTAGKYLNRGRPNAVIKTLIRDTDIPQDLHIHSLRHSFASIAINDGADANTVKELLGHSRVTTTQDIYAHIFDEVLARSMQGVSLALTDGVSIFGE